MRVHVLVCFASTRARVSLLMRMCTARCQVIAANIDQIIVIASFGNPPFSSLFLDRVLVAAHLADIPAMVVVNKMDLDKKRLFDEIRTTYEAAGYVVRGTQATTGQGVDALRANMQGKINALYGITGAGKSSLVNSLGGPNVRTGQVSEKLNSGRHTTTASNVSGLPPSTRVPSHVCLGMPR